jgi:hypothetical protein
MRGFKYFKKTPLGKKSSKLLQEQEVARRKWGEMSRNKKVPNLMHLVASAVFPLFSGNKGGFFLQQ